MTNWMTAAGLALIAGGLATLISFRSVLFGVGAPRPTRPTRRTKRANRENRSAAAVPTGDPERVGGSVAEDSRDLGEHSPESVGELESVGDHSLEQSREHPLEPTGDYSLVLAGEHSQEGEHSLGSETEHSLSLEGEHSLDLEGEHSLGLEGERPLGVEGEHSLGVAGRHALGTEEERSLAMVGEHSLGLAGEHSLGLVGEHSLGMVGEYSLEPAGKHTPGLVGEHSLGLVGEHSPELAGKRSLALAEAGKTSVGKPRRGRGNRRRAAVPAGPHLEPVLNKTVDSDDDDRHVGGLAAIGLGDHEEPLDAEPAAEFDSDPADFAAHAADFNGGGANFDVEPAADFGGGAANIDGHEVDFGGGAADVDGRAVDCDGGAAGFGSDLDDHLVGDLDGGPGQAVAATETGASGQVAEEAAAERDDPAGEIFVEAVDETDEETDAAAEVGRPKDREPVRVRHINRSDRRYGDRVDGWIRPQYEVRTIEPPTGEYWTPIPVELTLDDPEPSAKGYGWPNLVERLPPVPSYEPATGFDLAPVESEPTKVVMSWPPMPGDRSARVWPPRARGGRSENSPSRFETDVRPPGDREWASRDQNVPNGPARSRRHRDPVDDRSRFEDPAGESVIGGGFDGDLGTGPRTVPADDTRRRSVMSRRARAENRRRNGLDVYPASSDATQALSVISEDPERRRPRPRPEPVMDRSTTVYVSRHAADPPH